MSVFFYNKEAIDLNVVRLMGLNIKHTENPIGFFGTGLKFAVSVLLREGLTVTIVRESVAHLFDTITKNVRGEEVQIVRLDGEELGFTTQLGRNWQVWEAYRELHSNTLDEGGEISDEPPRPQDFDTIIVVEGAAIEEAFASRHDIFLNPEEIMIHKWCGVEIHEARDRFGFYRGIRAIELESPPLFAYNVLTDLELTEDRTIKQGFMFDHYVKMMIVRLDLFELLEEILLAGPDTFEHGLDFTTCGDSVSDTFLAVCAQHSKEHRLNPSALRLWKTKQPPKIIYTTHESVEMEEDKMQGVFDLLGIAGFGTTADDIVVAENLPHGRLSDVIEGSVVINKSIFELPADQIAACIIPRVIAAQHQIPAGSFEMQDHLAGALVHLAESVQASIDGKRIMKRGG